MNKLNCQKCGGKISNEFGVTLAYCTNCGAGIQNLQTPETTVGGEIPTLVSPNSPKYNPPSNSNRTRYFLGCLGLGFGAIVISVIGIFGYWSWSGKNPLETFTNQYNCEIAGEPEPTTSEEYFIRAQKHIEIFSGNGASSLDDCAFAALNEALRLDPNNTKALRLRGYGYRQRKQDDSALADYDKAIRIEPNNPDNYYVRRYFYEDREMFDKAIADQTAILNFLLGNNPADKQELIKEFEKRAELYEKQENYENAIKDYTEAIRIKPDSGLLFYRRAKAFEKKVDFENAVKDYTEVIRLDPEFEHYYYNRAEALRKLGKKTEAEADMKKFYELVSAKKDGKTSASPVTPTQSSAKTVSGGVLNGKATDLVQPSYPAAARAVRASGAVNVLVTVDEQGNVISATAVSGHTLLRASAVQAARESKFAPTLLSGKAVKVSGVIIFKFTL